MRERLRRTAALTATICGATLIAEATAATASTAENWLMYNGTYAGARYSMLHQIDRGNVGQLRPVCAFQLGELGKMQTGPVVVDGIMYITGNANTWALQAATCKALWKHEYESTGPAVGEVSHGVAFMADMLYRGTPDSHLIALDAKTGTLKWNVAVSDSSEGGSTIAAPIAWQDKIFIGIAGGERGIRGKVMAFAAADGRALWTFNTIPMGKEPGAETWERPETALHGGGGTWTSFTLDTDDGTLFVPVGNPGPDFAASYRPGANLFTDSIIALDANMGRLRWYHQLVANDYHDHDTSAAPAIYQDTKGRKLISFAGKDGYLVTLDYATHKLVSRVPVTTIANETAPLTHEGTRYCPGSLGGVEWNGPAYSDQTHLVYVGAIDWCSTTKLGDVRFVRGAPFLGSGDGFGQKEGTGTGWINAVDPVTGRMAWRYHADSPVVAGVTATAGGIVLAADAEGSFYVFDANNGAILYRFNTGGSAAGGLVTYAVNGKQFIAVASGNQSRTALPSNGAPMIFVFGL